MLVWSAAVFVRGLVSLWSDAAFVAGQWPGVTGVLISPWFGLVGLVVGLLWLWVAGSPSPKASPLDPASVEYKGVRWVHVGYYWGSEAPIGRAICAQHGVRLYYKPAPSISVFGTVMPRHRAPKDDDLIGSKRGGLWCIDGGGHPVDVDTGDAESVRFDDLQSEAEMIIEAEINRRTARV